MAPVCLLMYLRLCQELDLLQCWASAHKIHQGLEKSLLKNLCNCARRIQLRGHDENSVPVDLKQSAVVAASCKKLWKALRVKHATLHCAQRWLPTSRGSLSSKAPLPSDKKKVQLLLGVLRLATQYLHFWCKKWCYNREQTTNQNNNVIFLLSMNI